MKCGITGNMETHIPFKVEDYSIPRGGEYHKIDRIFDHIPWPGYKDTDKIYTSIDSINAYMTNEYNRKDTDIIALYRISKPQNFFSGATIYIFSDFNIKIKGEVFIVPICYIDRNLTHFFYIFRSIIRTPFEICPVTTAETIGFYNKFCEELYNFIKELGLIIVDKPFSSRIYNQYDPKDPCLNPRIFKYVENLDLQSFDDFMTRIEVLSGKYLLQSIGRRCRDFGKPLE